VSEMRSTDQDPGGNPDQVDLFAQPRLRLDHEAQENLRHRREREAREATEEAIARATANAKEQWFANAFEALCQVAQRLSDFTSADVWVELRGRGIGDPPEPRAMAGVMRRARKLKIAAPTDRYISGKSKDRHISSLRVWKSEVFCG
jgi:hypothetical protein